MTNWLIGGVVVLAILFGGFVLVGNNTEESPMKDDAMMEGDAMMQEKKTDDAMMQEDTVMMEKDTMTEKDAMMEGSDSMMQKGSYESYAAAKLSKANSGDVVLFFRASWCPTCKVLDADLRANSTNIPSGLTILDVNYDTETALKQKYGVTYQHTLVQVDAKGNMITKWSGGQTLASLVANVQ